MSTTVYADTLATLRRLFRQCHERHDVRGMGEMRRGIADLKRGAYGVDARCCQDCLILFANDDTSGWSGTDDELQAWLAAIDERTAGYHVALDGSDDDQSSFSWSSCDTCGSDLGGDRYAVTLFVVPE